MKNLNKKYQIRLTLDILTIRALLKEFNGLPRRASERGKLLIFWAEFEKILAEKEIEHCGKKTPHHLL